MNNANYYYKTVDSSSFRRLRKNREELVIAGCRKTRMLSFFPNGSVQKKRHMCSCESCLRDQFEECVLDAGDSKLIYEEGIDESNSDSEDIESESRSETMMRFVEEGAYVAVYSSENALEQFFIVKGVEKGIASKS